MPPSDPVTLQQRDFDVLEALCEDRSECGRGLTRADLEGVGATRWPHRCLRRLREAGHRIASIGTGEEGERWQLLDPESYVSDREKRAEQVKATPQTLNSDARLFTLPPVPHYDVKAQAA
jgi:hypothetical protein